MYDALVLSCFMKKQCAEDALSRASCVLARWLAWVLFGELSNAAESPPLALQAARKSGAGPARHWSVGRISLFIWNFLLPPCPVWFAWPRAPPGLLSSFPPGMSLIAFSVTHFKIWAKKLRGKLMWYLLFMRRLAIQLGQQKRLITKLWHLSGRNMVFKAFETFRPCF